MHPERPEKGTDPPTIEAVSRRGPGGPQPGAGRKPTHGTAIMRRTLRTLTTRRLDGRSAVAVAVRAWKADVARDLGGDLSRAQGTILEAAAQSWVILQSIDDYIARQPSLVTRKRAQLPIVRERMAIAEGLAKSLERLGLERRARDVPTLEAYLAAKGPGERSAGSGEASGRQGGTEQPGADQGEREAEHDTAEADDAPPDVLDIHGVGSNTEGTP